MTEENKTGNEVDAGDADQATTGKEDVTAGGQQDVTPDAEGTQDEKYKAAIAMANAEKEKRQTAEQEAQLARDQMALLQANQQVQTQQVQQPTSTYERALQDCGFRDEVYLSQEQQIKVNARKDQLDATNLQQQQSAIANQQFVQSHSDYGAAVGQNNMVTGQFMVSAELQKILMEKPHLRGSCLTSEGAYKVVMEQRELAKLTTTSQQQQTQQQIDTKLSPMSPAAAGGGAVDRTVGQITENSTAEDIRKVQEQVRAGKFG